MDLTSPAGNYIIARKNSTLRSVVENFYHANSIESSGRKLTVSASSDISFLTRKFQSSAR